MNSLPHSLKNYRNRGYATFAMVAAISLALLTLLTLNLSSSIRSMDVQKTAQLKQDYSQREDAILNALLHIVPNKAIGAMQRHSANNTSAYTWETIFDEALELANAEQAVDPLLLSALNLNTAVSANTGDTSITDINTLVSRPAPSPLTGTGIVNGGNWHETNMLFQANLYDNLPAPLMASTAHAKLDKEYPIVSLNKLFVDRYQTKDQIYHKGVELSTDIYPLYNQLRYPDVKFGYKKPGDPFVAKRNWWVFSLTFGKNDEATTGVPAVTRDYLLSIYEVPSQLPISSTTTMNVGQFANGTAWSNVNIEGSIYARRLNTDGTVSVTGGTLAARETLNVSNSTTVGGTKIENNFDNLGSRESRAADSGSTFYNASLQGNSGKVSFIPINRGSAFLWPGGDGSSSERISPTGWNYYSRGASQCAMRIEMREMNTISDQIPIEVRFRYKGTDGSNKTKTYTRGNNWPTDLEAGGTLFPFQTTQLDNLRYAMSFYPNRLEAFLDSLGNAAPVDINNSICIYPNTGRSTVEAPSIPSNTDDLAVTLRGCKDMSMFTNGFSLVTRYRLYISESFNVVTTTPPANSGLPANAEFYPPCSLFAPEKRFGETILNDQPVAIKGQLSSLKTGASYQFNPLELRAGNDAAVSSGQVNADLVDLRSPAELPPIHMMNWLVTIEPLL